MRFREMMRAGGVTPPDRLPPMVEYGLIGETDAAFVSVFDTGDNHGPRFGYAVYMREGFFAKRTAPFAPTEEAARIAVDNEWGPIQWHPRTTEPCE